MNNQIRKAAAASVLVFLSFGALAANNEDWYWVFYDGNRLYELCNADSDSVPASVCMTYIAGAYESYKFLPKYGYRAEGAPDICVPSGTSLEQFRLVVLNWMKKNPTTWNLLAAELVIAALHESWPCS